MQIGIGLAITQPEQASGGGGGGGYSPSLDFSNALLSQYLACVF